MALDPQQHPAHRPRRRRDRRGGGHRPGGGAGAGALRSARRRLRPRCGAISQRRRATSRRSGAPSSATCSTCATASRVRRFIGGRRRPSWAPSTSWSTTPAAASWRAFLDVSEKGQDALVRENFAQVTNCIRAAAPLMTTGRGSIINITSIEAHRAGPGFAIYSAMKAAVANLTKSLALELGERMIRVNCIAPDVIPTPGIGELAGEDAAAARRARRRRRRRRGLSRLRPGPVRHRCDPARRRRQLGRRRLAARAGRASRHVARGAGAVRRAAGFEPCDNRRAAARRPGRPRACSPTPACPLACSADPRYSADRLKG